MKKLPRKLLPSLLFLLSVPLLNGCAFNRYTTTQSVGTNTVRTVNTTYSLFSTSSFKGLVVTGNGTNRDANGLRITGVATDPNASAITASTQALGDLIGAAAGAAAKSAVRPIP